VATVGDDAERELFGGFDGFSSLKRLEFFVDL
jgi:hypothetical protein